ncbi:hypothetical protein [Azoarcus olearius]|uniref:N-acetyl sugar amidotransferase n=1 Tax=Azoarcus sp. (strain BH72) TaxID=418699 RepID=A1KAD2_AZOSB|nr:hypothetical protein [Azoarcus olearius]ANQ86330.1 hypothetical protein dqs_3303 [Azoarcus olearius]CAL95788.1 conserved hypothetical protein [Azoarcus olearius]
MKKCRKCLLPEAVPGADIDASGVCAACRAPSSRAPIATVAANFLPDLEETLRAARNHQGSDYDCIVPLSGGKDSLWLLHKLKVEYGLRVLAYTCNIDLPDVAWNNIRLALRKLNIDHLVFTPAHDFLTKLFRYLLCNQEARGAVYSVSYVYAPLFEGAAIRLAIEKNIPLVLAGYSPGQPEPERMLYEFSPELIRAEDWTPPHLKESGAFSAQELSAFYNPARLPEGTRFPRYLAPYHAWEYDQAEVIRKVAELGLVKRSAHASPIVSNYPINWLMMYSDLKHFGYNPYAPEFAALIREGKANRNYWRVMAPVVDFMIRNKIGLGKEVRRSMAWLDLKDEDLRITLPRGAYDPPLVQGRMP